MTTTRVAALRQQAIDAAARAGLARAVARCPAMAATLRDEAVKRHVLALIRDAAASSRSRR